jgi:hypothetical protein
MVPDISATSIATSSVLSSCDCSFTVFPPDIDAAWVGVRVCACLLWWKEKKRDPVFIRRGTRERDVTSCVGKRSTSHI